MYTDEVIYCQIGKESIQLPDSVPAEGWPDELKLYWKNTKKDLAQKINEDTALIHVECLNNVNSIVETINTMHKFGYDLAGDLILEPMFGIYFYHMFFQKNNNMLNVLSNK